MSECDWHRLWPPGGVRKCDRPAAVVRDGYGGGRDVRFCEMHDPVGVDFPVSSELERE